MAYSQIQQLEWSSKKNRKFHHIIFCATPSFVSSKISPQYFSFSVILPFALLCSKETGFFLFLKHIENNLTSEPLHLLLFPLLLPPDIYLCDSDFLPHFSSNVRILERHSWIVHLKESHSPNSLFPSLHSLQHFLPPS